MTQIATRDERNTTPDLIHSSRDTGSKSQMILIRKKTVPERHHWSTTSVAQQKVEWHGRSVIEKIVRERRDVIILLMRRASDCR